MPQEPNGRFRFLFASLMILVAVMPFLRPGAFGAGILQLLFTLLLLSGIYVVSDGKRALVAAALFAGPALVLAWAGRFTANTALDGIGALLLAGFSHVHCDGDPQVRRSCAPRDVGTDLRCGLRLFDDGYCWSALVRCARPVVPGGAAFAGWCGERGG